MFKPLYESKARYKIYYGGRGSSKSWGFAEALVHHTSKYNVRVLCCREVQKSIRDSSYRLILDTIERYGLLDQYYVTNNTIRHIYTGSTIIFDGLRNSTALKSMAGIDICWVEEGESVTLQSWTDLRNTIRDNGSEIWISFNPRFTVDPTWQLFVENPPTDSVVVHMNYNHNPFFPAGLEQERQDEYDKCLKTGDMQRYEWIWLGKPIGEEFNTLITPGIIQEARERNLYPSNDEAIVAGLDVARYGDDDIEFVVRQGNEIIGNEKLLKGDTLEVAEWAIDLIVRYNVGICVVDAAGSAGVFDIINSRFRGGANICEVVEYNGAYAAKDSANYLNLRAESWDLMRLWLLDKGTLPWDKKWDELSLVTYTYKGKETKALKSKDIMRKDGIKSPNAGDALSMTFSVDAKKKSKVAMSDLMPRTWQG